MARLEAPAWLRAGAPSSYADAVAAAEAARPDGCARRIAEIGGLHSKLMRQPRDALARIVAVASASRTSPTRRCVARALGRAAIGSRPRGSRGGRSRSNARRRLADRSRRRLGGGQPRERRGRVEIGDAREICAPRKSLPITAAAASTRASADRAARAGRGSRRAPPPESAARPDPRRLRLRGNSRATRSTKTDCRRTRRTPSSSMRRRVRRRGARRAAQPLPSRRSRRDRRAVRRLAQDAARRGVELGVAQRAEQQDTGRRAARARRSGRAGASAGRPLEVVDRTATPAPRPIAAAAPSPLRASGSATPRRPALAARPAPAAVRAAPAPSSGTAACAQLRAERRRSDCSRGRAAPGASATRRARLCPNDSGPNRSGSYAPPPAARPPRR